VLDAGCGTGRVGIELARRGYEVEGIDLDPGMLAVARRAAPELAWHDGDVATFDLARTFDAVVLAGNVLIFVAPDTEAHAVARCAAHLGDGGLLIAGFQVRPGGLGPDRLDADAAAAGLSLRHRWSTWDRRPWMAGGGYQVSVHAR
jgi:SAM-dependent methyltransferase